MTTTDYQRSPMSSIKLRYSTCTYHEIQQLRIQAPRRVVGRLQARRCADLLREVCEEVLDLQGDASKAPKLLLHEGHVGGQAVPEGPPHLVFVRRRRHREFGHEALLKLCTDVVEPFRKDLPDTLPTERSQ